MIFLLIHQPCGSLSRTPISASSFSMKACRSLVAVGSGGRGGPTGPPLVTLPASSEDGYRALDRCPSRVILHFTARPRGHSAALHPSNNAAAHVRPAEAAR